jgi:hypothetical protein
MGTKALEIVLDGYSLSGELSLQGAPRRLVDILNSLDEPLLNIENAVVNDFSGAEHRRFDVVQVHSSEVLFAIPIGGDLQQADAFETVQKVPVESTIAFPGYEIDGMIHLLPGASPEAVHVVTQKHFLPLTDATITPLQDQGEARHVHVAVVNPTRALLFAPHTRVPAIA